MMIEFASKRQSNSIHWLIISVMLVAACSNQQVYDNAREYQRQNCEKLPQGQYQQCMDKVATDYETYEQQRKEDSASE